VRALLLALLTCDPDVPPAAPARPGPGDLLAPPRSADPWPALRQVPGVVPDRVSVAGSDTAQQSVLVFPGDNGTGAAWLLDGLDVTDVAAPGALAVQLDLDALERLEGVTHTLDARVRSAGVQVGAWTRAPRDRPQGAAHLRFANDALQAGPHPDPPRLESRTGELLELGAELGAPVAQGVHLWGAAARVAHRQQAFTGHDEEIASTSLLARASLDRAPFTTTLLGGRTEKTHDGRDPVTDAAPEARWRQSGPAHFVSLRARRAGRVSLELRLGLVDGGFDLEPEGGSAPEPFEDVRGVFRGSYATVSTRRRRAGAAGEAAGGGGAAGFRHAWSAGAGGERRTTRSATRWPGHQVLGLERGSVFFRTFGLTGFALPVRDADAAARVDALHLFLQDEARRGRLRLHAGLRLEHLRGTSQPSAVEANPTFPDLLPAVSWPGGGTGLSWLDALPRLGVGWEEDRWSAQGGWGLYAAPLPAGEAGFENPLSREASLTYYWRDLDRDRQVDHGELDELFGRAGASNVDPEDPGSARSPHLVDPGLRAPLTSVAAASFARRVGGATELTFTAQWRRVRLPAWRPLRGLSSADYVARGAVTGELHGEPYSVVYYAPGSLSLILPGQGRVLANREGYHQDAVALDLVGLGRAGPVAWRAWLAFGEWRERFTDRAVAVHDPTPLDTEPLQDGGPVAVRPGGLGRADVFVNARFSAGLTASSRLPLGLEGWVRGWAREGFPVPYVQVANTGDPTAGSKPVLVAPTLTRHRMPAVVLLDAAVRRPVRLGAAEVTVALEVFNVLDAATVLQAERDVEATRPGRSLERMRPRLARLGLELRF
jgi:hypothetical protein